LELYPTLKKDIDLKFINIDVPELGIARISGMVLTSYDQIKLSKAVESVGGVSSIQSNVVLVPNDFA
jgi:hypothetical protein